MCTRLTVECARATTNELMLLQKETLIIDFTAV